jgi:hypothetical protein
MSLKDFNLELHLYYILAVEQKILCSKQQDIFFTFEGSAHAIISVLLLFSANNISVLHLSV